MDQRPLTRYPNTVPGFFVRRLNRFTAEVMIYNHLEKVHVKKNGMLRELMLINIRRLF
jgi:sugar fermentation stimulation protein A